MASKSEIQSLFGWISFGVRPNPSESYHKDWITLRGGRSKFNIVRKFPMMRIGVI